MPQLEIPPLETAERLFTLVADRAPRLLPSCRWLLLGPELAAIVLPRHAREPSFSDLTALLRLLRGQAPELMSLAVDLVQASALAEAALLDLVVDRLLERSDWQHPTQILPRPRPDFTTLLHACQSRLKRTRGDRRRQVEEATAKVARAARIAEGAREKRKHMRRKAARASRTK